MPSLLRDYIASSPLDLKTFFSLALPLVEHLEALHRRGTGAGDLRPDTVAVDPASGTVAVLPAPLAAGRSGRDPAAQSLLPPEEGRLHYLAPEQTGRIGRPVDHRSDFYSLGIIFYELLTGRLPFPAGDDPLAWYYAHLALLPQPPHAHNPAVPPGLSDVVGKMLAKAPEERYQSAAGLKADLEYCFRQWSLTGTVAPFPLGRRDLSGRLRFPARLYGRERELLLLNAALARVCRGEREVVLVSGLPGVGKTALVNELRGAVVSVRGYFLQGKFEQYQGDTPYVALTRAIQSLVRQVLTESPAGVARWQVAAAEALGPGGAVLARFVPELELLTGPLPVAAHLPPVEARNRLLLALRSLLKVFTSRGHPLVIFLDDLHWADPASLQVLASLLAGLEGGQVLCLGAYRDTEVGPSHPLPAAVASFEEAGVPVGRLSLEGLERPAMGRLVADALGCDEDEAAPLAALVWQRTVGNCFHARQLLRNLYEEGLLAYDPERQRWRWQVEAIRRTTIPADVVELVLRRLGKLPPQTQAVLKVASCMGGVFDVCTLALACGCGPGETAADLRPAVDLGILLPADEPLPAPEPAEGDVGSLPGSYEFLHDRVQQAVYSLLPAAEKREVHYRVGRILLQQAADPARLERGLFAIVDHLNEGREAMASPQERRELARYNLLAARKAYAAAAFPAALRYLEAGAALLAADVWAEDYRLAFDLYLEMCRCRYLCGQMEAAEDLFRELLARAREPADRAGV